MFTHPPFSSTQTDKLLRTYLHDHSLIHLKNSNNLSRNARAAKSVQKKNKTSTRSDVTPPS